MRLRRIAPLLPLVLLPVAVVAWAQDGDPSGAGAVGVGIGVTVMGILATLVRRQEMGVLLSAIAGLVRGQRTGAEDPTVQRIRRKLGLPLDPDEALSNTGLLVDVARHEAEIIGMRAELAGLRAAVEQSNKLLTEVLSGRP